MGCMHFTAASAFPTSLDFVCLQTSFITLKKEGSIVWFQSDDQSIAILLCFFVFLIGSSEDLSKHISATQMTDLYLYVFETNKRRGCLSKCSRTLNAKVIPQSEGLCLLFHVQYINLLCFVTMAVKVFYIATHFK